MPQPDDGKEKIIETGGRLELTADDICRALGLPAGVPVQVSLPAGGGWGEAILLVRWGKEAR